MRTTLRFVAPFRCMLEHPFEKGEVRRVLDLPLGLIGYQVSCPGCGTRQVFLAEEVTFREGPSISETDPHADPPRIFLRPSTVHSHPPVTCLRCRLKIRFDGDAIVVG